MTNQLKTLPESASKQGFKTVFLTLHGSQLYGMATPNSDYDYIGACIEPEELVIGLGKFEQHEWKNEAISSEGTTYSLRKYIRLLIEGNPTILASSFSPIAYDLLGITSDDFHNLFASKLCGPKFYGYMKAQMHRLHTGKGLHVTRAHLIDQYGFDTKYAAHVIRLGFQAVEYLGTGKIQLPILEDPLKIIMDVRHGVYSYSDFKQMAEDMLSDVDAAYKASQLPEKPDYDAVSQWLVNSYISQWDYR